MFNLLFGTIYTDDRDTPITLPLLDTFKQEGDWLTKKRQEVIEKDKMGANRMLINSPNRTVTLFKPTVLV